jgi:SAM-dependent methyltransferase
MTEQGTSERTTSGAPIDLQQVLREIDEEVKARRASGDFPPGLERDLDLTFARFAPAAVSGDDLAGLIEAAERTSFVDPDPPTGSRLPPAALLKKVQRKLLGWYFRYLSQQVTAFGGSVVQVLRQLARRLEAVERAVPGVDPATVAAARGASTPAAAGDLAGVITAALAGVTGRVLVTEAGDGSLVRLLGDAGADAYGVEPRLELAESAALSGLEVRDDEPLVHLAAVAHEALAALVLLGCTDRSAQASQVSLIAEAARTLTPGGTVVILGTNPDAWGRDTDPVEADLAPGRPFHAATWVHLLEARGFTGARVEERASRYAVIASR